MLFLMCLCLSSEQKKATQQNVSFIMTHQIGKLLLFLMNFFRISEAAQRWSLKVVVSKTALWWQTQQGLLESAVLPQGSGLPSSCSQLHVHSVQRYCAVFNLKLTPQTTRHSDQQSEQSSCRDSVFLWMDKMWTQRVKTKFTLDVTLWCVTSCC